MICRDPLLPQNLVGKIASYLPWSAWCRVALTCRQLEEEKEQCSEAQLRKTDFVEQRLDEMRVPHWIREASDRESMLRRTCFVNLERRSFTGYIDFITPSDFPEGYSVIIGRDPHDRFYLACRYVSDTDSLGGESPRVVCLFQRYGNDTGIFVDAGQHLHHTWSVSRTDAYSDFFNRTVVKLAPEHAQLLELISRGHLTLQHGCLKTQIECRLAPRPHLKKSNPEREE